MQHTDTPLGGALWGLPALNLASPSSCPHSNQRLCCVSVLCPPSIPPSGPSLFIAALRSFPCVLSPHNNLFLFLRDKKKKAAKEEEILHPSHLPHFREQKREGKKTRKPTEKERDGGEGSGGEGKKKKNRQHFNCFLKKWR